MVSGAEIRRGEGLTDGNGAQVQEVGKLLAAALSALQLALVDPHTDEVGAGEL